MKWMENSNCYAKHRFQSRLKWLQFTQVLTIWYPQILWYSYSRSSNWKKVYFKIWDWKEIWIPLISLLASWTVSVHFVTLIPNVILTHEKSWCGYDQDRICNRAGSLETSVIFIIIWDLREVAPRSEGETGETTERDWWPCSSSIQMPFGKWAFLIWNWRVLRGEKSMIQPLQ